MLLKAFNDQKYLESLTGLDKLGDDAVLESVEWDEEDDGGALDDDF
jgi:ubiquitin-like modifier-activating enzyme ATG7